MGDAPSLAERSPDRPRRGQLANLESGGYPFDLPDARKFSFMVQDFQRSGTPPAKTFLRSDQDSLMFAKDVPNLEVLPPSCLPRQAIGLAGVDLVTIPLADLQKLARHEAERFTSLTRHIRSGGNLIVYGDGDVCGETEDLLGINSNTWQRPQQHVYARAMRTWEDLMGRDSGASKVNRAGSDNDVSSELPVFQVGPLGLGRVAAIQSYDPFQWDTAYWQWVLATMGNERLSWHTRHGISLIHNNDDYWNFMIPGFGAAPVKSFLATITLFIVLIGPVNYYLLRRAKRLYLLPLTVGGAALVTTVAMLCFAVIRDGISTKVRLRSFTQLDQTQGLAATHCRQAYLAAIAPSDGLSFPSQNCVYPLVPFQQSRYRHELQNDRAAVRTLTKGYLQSRSTAQFLVTSVVETEASLAIEQTDGELVVTNQLGVTVTHLWLWNQSGRLFRARETAAGERCRLHPSEVVPGRNELSDVMFANRLQRPDGLDSGIDRMMLGSLGLGGFPASNPVKFDKGLLEKNIAAVRDFFTTPRPGSYLAVTQQAPPFVSIGTKAKQEAGFHVIRGTWGNP